MTGSEHFIPLTRADATQLALERAPPAARAELADVARLLAGLLHVEFHERLEALKGLYAPLDPDADTRRPASLPATAPAAAAHELSARLAEVLRSANYVELPRAELAAALEQDSPFQLRVHVDLEQFADLVVFTRGRRRERVQTRRWGRRREHEMDVLERVVVLARVKEASELPEDRREDLALPPGRTLVKLFRNVPAADMEMVLPNVQVRMRGRDHAMLGVPAVVGGVILLVTKLSTSLLLAGALVAFWLGLRDDEVQIGAPELLGLGLALAALATFVLRQRSAFKNRKFAFMKALADNLYFRSLDHGAGVFHRLIDEAEEQDGKEAFLAYVALLQRPGVTETELDAHVEGWLQEWCGTAVDFEADDALAKLERLQLLRRAGERLSVVPPAEARVLLDQRWDDWFLFANEARG